MNYSRGPVFAAGCVVIFIFGISLITLGATLPQLTSDFGLSEIDKGTLASVLPIGILIGSLIFGPIVDKYSYRHFLAISIFLIACGFFLIVFAREFIHLVTAFILIGTGGGALNGASSSLVSDLSDDFKENKGANLSILGTFYGLGALGMPVILNLLSSWFGYREIIGGVGAVMLFAILYIEMIKYPLPKQSSTVSVQQVIKLLKQGSLLMLSMILFFQSGWESLINNWLTTYLIERKGTSAPGALYMLTLFSAVFTAGRFIIGIILRHFAAKITIFISCVTAITGCVMLSTTSSELMTIVGIILCGLGLAAGFPVVLGMVGDRYSSFSGTAFGIVLTIALIGNMFINYITGILSEVNGLEAFTWMLIISGVLTLVFISFSMAIFRDR